MKKSIKITTIVFILGISILGACTFFIVQGSGKIVSESRDVNNFSSILLYGTGNLTIFQGGYESLTVETDDNLMEFIETGVESGTLYIGTANGVILKPSQGIYYYLHVKEIRTIVVSGSSKVYANSLYVTDTFYVKVSGSTRLEIDDITADNIDINVSGSGYVDLSGESEALNIGISGDCTHNSSNLECMYAMVDISGSGNVTLWVTKSLQVDISGDGDVKYYGNPTVNVALSGSGNVVPLGAKQFY